MGGVLEFTLGLEVNDFLRKVGITSENVLGLAGAWEVVRKAYEGIEATIARGAALGELSKRTGETVSNLYMLEKGFRAVGISAENVGPMIYQMNKSMGGINELGEKTQDVFKRLGLNLKALKNEGGAGAMRDILGSLSKLDQSGATKAAASIFGRMGAADAIQISRSMEEVNEAMKRASPQAYIFEKMADCFDAIERSVRRIKAIWEPFWLGIAQYAAGPIRDVLEKLSNIDLSKLGQQFGKVIGLILNSIGDGTFSQTITLAIQIGFEKGAFYAAKFASALAAAIAVALPPALKIAFEAVKTLMTYPGAIIGNKAALYAAQQELTGMETVKKQTLEMWPKEWTPDKEAQLQNQRFMVQDMERGAQGQAIDAMNAQSQKLIRSLADGGEMAKNVTAAWTKAWNASGAAPTTAADLEMKKLLDGFQKKMDAMFPDKMAGKGSPNTGSLDQNQISIHHTEGNLFEKMGMVMRGSGGLSGDVAGYQRDTARNTAEIVGVLRDKVVMIRNDDGSSAAVLYHQPI
jgi:hypothetical protein